ncbi:MAG TPA: ribonuclease III [Chlamydiales bacterium]|nr:ribonuclease III [Chlamydiales bacterium]
MTADQLMQLKGKIPQIEEKIGYTFQKKDLLIAAFTHRSYVNEAKDKVLIHNERLEFLGDSVLGLVLSEYLYQRLPDQPEGRLSQLRSALVDAPSCAQYLLKLELGDSILLGKGEKMSMGQGKISIQANAFEALVAALYLDGGFFVASTFLTSHFGEIFELTIEKPPVNYKAQLQDFSQKQFQKPPVYQVVEEGGPEHAKVFHVRVLLDGEESGRGDGHSKKEAEQKAAFEALTKIGACK